MMKKGEQIRKKMKNKKSCQMLIFSILQDFQSEATAGFEPAHQGVADKVIGG